ELIPDKSYITLNIRTKDSETERNYIKDFCLHAPEPGLLNCTIDDSSSGNGDFIVDPGETLDLVVKIFNRGSSKISGTINVTNSPPGVDIHNYSLPIVLNPGEIIPVHIPVTISPVLKKGSTFEIYLLTDCDPYFSNKVFTIPVGKILESFEYQTFSIFPWNNNHSNPWTITSTHYFEGLFSARSGIIGHNNESKLSLKINVPHADSMYFMYKVSSENNYDFLIFALNGKQVFSASGETEWLEKKIILNEGFNLLEWIYKKDQAIISGSDCAWIDYLTFPADAFNKIDIKTGKIISPESGKKLGQETITAEIINLGIDTVKQFNLAYIINSWPVVSEKFTKTINPGDTTVVSFAVKADLSTDGTYILKVFSFNNNDSFLLNDTTTITMLNTAINDIINPESDLKVMPNPFSDRINLSLSAKSFESVKITLINITGTKVWEKKIEVLPGENHITITPYDLPPGYYTLKMSGKTILRTIRIIKSE
ncbi:MAG: T9SS type A sorting domain-containing protein, partial [Bacteroidales bacterium]